MGTPTVKTQFVAEGEKEYRAAIAEMNSGLKTLDSEMKLVTERFKGNEDSMEALTAKSDVLNRKYETQKAKVEELRKALENAKKAYGESDERTQQWARSLNNAEAQMLKTEHELESLNETMTESNVEMTGLGELLDNVAGKFGVSLPESLKSSLDGFLELDAGFATFIESSAAVVAAIAKIEEALIDIAEEAALRADDILTQSSITNLTTDTVQELQYASELIDVSYNTISSALTKLTRNLSDAADGSDTATEKFDALGLSIYNDHGHLKSAETMFYEIIDVLGQMTNDTERDAAAMGLLGRSAQDLNPLIKAGSETLAEFRQEAHDVGYVMDSETLATLNDLSDAMYRYEKATEAANDKMGAEFAPMLTDFYESMATLQREWGEVAADSGLVAFFGDLLELVAALIDALPSFSDDIEWLAIVFNSLGTAVGLVVDGVKALSALYNIFTGALSGLLTGDYSSVADNWDVLTGILTGGNSSTVKNARRLSASVWNASGTSDFPGGMTWVGENGPEIVSLPRGSQILNAQESRSVGGDVFYITIPAKDIKEFQDIIKVAQNARREERQGRV